MTRGMKVRGIMKKNQLVLTVLAVIVVVAGYITLSGNEPIGAGVEGNGTAASTEGNILGNSDLLNNVSEADVWAENQERLDAMKDETGSSANDYSNNGSGRPGEAVLTSGVTVSNFIAQQRLTREQTRSTNKETLLDIIESEVVSDEQKQSAIDSMAKLTDIAERENATETMLSSKGFDDAIVSISDNQVDVVICRNAISEAEKAQIEDIVKRKTNMGIECLVITLMEVQETSETVAESVGETN